MPVDDINRKERRCIRDRWAYWARFALLELWCAGQAVALRFLHGIRGGRSDRLHLTFRRTHQVEDGSEEQASSSRLPADSKKKPRGRLRVIGDRMLEHKGDLVALIHDWNVAMPDDPTMIRIPDPPRESVRVRACGVTEDIHQGFLQRGGGKNLSMYRALFARRWQEFEHV